MNDSFIWLIILGASLMLGMLKYEAAQKEGTTVHKINERLNHFAGFLIGGSVLYYLISVRIPLLVLGDEASFIDLLLLLIVSTCVFGWFPYLIKNLTVGIDKIFGKAAELLNK